MEAMIVHDEWLSTVFGHGVYRVQIDPAEKGAGVVRAVLDDASRKARALYFALVDAESARMAREWGAAGFFVAESRMELRLEASRSRMMEEVRPRDVTVGLADPKHHPDVLNLAETGFRYSRFHADPLVPLETANRVKREWVRSYVERNRGKELLVALRGGKAAGFLAVLERGSHGRRKMIIDLVAVAPAHRGQGIGSALVGEFIRRYQDDADDFEVSTQASNLPSLRLYGRFGFAPVRLSYVLHMHVREGGPVRPE